MENRNIIVDNLKDIALILMIFNHGDIIFERAF